MLDSKLIHKQNFYSFYSGLGQNTMLIGPRPGQNWFFLWEKLLKKGWKNLKIVSHFRARTLYVCFLRSLSVPTVLLNLQALSSNCSRYWLLLFLIELIHKCFLELFTNWHCTKILEDILPRFFFLGSIVPSNILSSRSRSATLKNPTDKVWERRDSNPGLLGEKCERYLCAMLPPSSYQEMKETIRHLTWLLFELSSLKLGCDWW